jgi:transposase
MDAYSQDLRERVARACDGGELSQPEVAQAFGVSLSFITKLLRRKRLTGSVAAKPHSGGRVALLKEKTKATLRDLVKKQPDATLAEYCHYLAQAASVRVSPSTMCRALESLKLRRKKKESSCIGT